MRKKRAETRAARSALPLWWRSLRVALPLLSLALCIGVIGWLFHIGWPQSQWRMAKAAAASASQRSGFVISQVYVTGRKEVSRDEIMAAIKVKRGDPLFAFDPVAARESLETIPWVSMARVERKWPDTINIFIVERTPYARWQIDGHDRLVDRTGIVLADHVPDAYADLPLIVGKGAPEAADSLKTLLARWPLFDRELLSAVRVGDRRWDLYLSAAGLAQATPQSASRQAAAGQASGAAVTQPGPDDVLIVRLPADPSEAATALARLAQYGETTDLFLRPLAIIDLRLADRLILRPRQMGANKVLETPDKTDKKVIIEPEDNDSGIEEDPKNPI